MSTRAGVQPLLLKLHIIALIIALLNAGSRNLFAFSFNSQIEVVFRIFAVGSGLILFFHYLKPFKKLSLYFSVYALLMLFFLLGLTIRGIFGAILISIAIFPIMPDYQINEENGVIVTELYSGTMGTCCYYKVSERKLIIFDKEYGRFKSEGAIQLESLEIQRSEEEITLTYMTDYYYNSVVRTIKPGQKISE